MNLLNLLRRQAQLYSDLLFQKLDGVKTKAEVYKAHSTILNEFYNHAFKPTTTKNGIREFKVDQTNEMMDTIKTDIDIAYEELDNVSGKLQEVYNTNQDYRTAVKNRIQYLTSIIGDLNIMSDQSDETFMMFKDSLTNYDFIDKNFSTGTNASISTAEGIAHLAISEDNLITQNISEVKVNGDGINGNYHVVKKINVETINPDYDIFIKYKSDDDPHDAISTITDSQSQTWFEYEKIGFSDTYKVNRYDIEWANATKIGDELTLKVMLKLKESSEINWINITPYMPENSRGSVRVYSIRVSLSGSEFTPIYKDQEIIDSEISLVPQRYQLDPLFNNDTVAKFASEGVFVFPKVKAQHIEIILKQNKPYDEFIGNTYYKETNISDSVAVERIIPAQQVPASILQGPIGKYQIGTNKFITKSIEVIDGWRYCIGLRGIDIYKRKFVNQAELITNTFETTEPIQKIVLYANEIIPDEYITYGLEKRNDWIKYYITINDTDWFPISPMHHNQVGALSIPPKIYEINSTASVDERISTINKGYLTYNGDVKSVRLKVVFTRPDELTESTPILEEYGLKCIFGGNV